MHTGAETLHLKKVDEVWIVAPDSMIKMPKRWNFGSYLKGILNRSASSTTTFGILYTGLVIKKRYCRVGEYTEQCNQDDQEVGSLLNSLELFSLKRRLRWNMIKLCRIHKTLDRASRDPCFVCVWPDFVGLIIHIKSISLILDYSDTQCADHGTVHTEVTVFKRHFITEGFFFC